MVATQLAGTGAISYRKLEDPAGLVTYPLALAWDLTELGSKSLMRDSFSGCFLSTIKEDAFMDFGLALLYPITYIMQ